MEKLGFIFLMAFSLTCVSQDCTGIQKTVDKFDGTIRFYSPLTLVPQITYLKTIRANGDTTIWIRLSAYGNTPSIGKKGAIILLANGKKLEKPNAEVDCKVYSGGIFSYQYDCMFYLNHEDIALLKEDYITDYRLYVHDGVLTKKKQKLAMQDLFCIVDAN